MAAVKKQTLDEARELLAGFTDGIVPHTKPLYTNGKSAILAGKIRKFIAKEGTTIIGFEQDNKLANTYVHGLPKQRQLQLGTFKKIADGLGLSCKVLFEQLVKESGGKFKKAATTPEKVATAPKTDVLTMSDDSIGIDISRVPSEPQLVLTGIPEIGTIIIGLTTKRVEFVSKGALRRALCG